MNVDRGQESFTAEEELELRKRLLAYKTDNGKTWATVAAEVGIVVGTLSVWATGSYNKGQPAPQITAAVNKFFLHQEAQAEIDRAAPIVPKFQATRTAKRIIGALRWGHRGKVVVIVGDPGVGKTAALDQYCAITPNAWKATMSPSTARLRPALVAVLQAMGVNSRPASTMMLSSVVRDRAANREGLLIIDEAQHLTQEALEELRAIHDETGCGLVLCGNRQVLTRIEGASRDAAFAQLYSRVSVRLIIAGPHVEDLALLLTAWKVTDERERSFLTEIAKRPGGGAVRSLTNTLEYATILAMDEAEADRVLEHLKDAWAALSTRTATA